jgi:hypothetical protein
MLSVYLIKVSKFCHLLCVLEARKRNFFSRRSFTHGENGDQKVNKPDPANNKITGTLGGNIIK